jgi:hypothetical protein
MIHPVQVFLGALLLVLLMDELLYVVLHIAPGARP